MLDWIRRRVTLRYMDRLLTAEMERYACLHPETPRDVAKGFEKRIDELTAAVEILKYGFKP